MEQVTCRNHRAACGDWVHTDLPDRQRLEGLRLGDYLRVSLESGQFFWVELVSRQGKRLLVRSVDNLPCGQVRIGDEFPTSTGAVFSIV